MKSQGEQQEGSAHLTIENMYNKTENNSWGNKQDWLAQKGRIKCRQLTARYTQKPQFKKKTKQFVLQERKKNVDKGRGTTDAKYSGTKYLCS